MLRWVEIDIIDIIVLTLIATYIEHLLARKEELLIVLRVLSTLARLNKL